MINEVIIKKAAEAGLPALKELFNKMPKEDLLKALAFLSTVVISCKGMEVIRDICNSRIGRIE